MDAQTTVFISHTPSEAALATQIVSRLSTHSIHTYVPAHTSDRAALDLALNTAPIAIFLLSSTPPAPQALVHLKALHAREDTCIRRGRVAPKLIPVYVGVTRDACKNMEKGADRDAMQRLSACEGIESRGEPDESLVDRLVQLVKNRIAARPDATPHRPHQLAADDLAASAHPAAITHTHDPAFTPFFDPCINPSTVYATAAHAQLHAAVLQELDENAHAVLCVAGVSGIGKSVALRGLCDGDEVRTRFVHGVYRLRLSAQTCMHAHELAVALTNAIRLSGGALDECDLETAVTAGVAWFARRSCLFLLDNVADTDVDKTLVSSLARVCAGGTGSVLVFASRDEAMLQHECVTAKIHMRPLELRGKEARAIFMRTATGDENSVTLPSTDLPMVYLFDYCEGIPLVLALMGKICSKVSLELPAERPPDMGEAYDVAVTEYFNIQACITPQGMDPPLNLLDSIQRAVKTGMRIIERYVPRADEGLFQISYAKMFRSFCVLDREQEIPVSVLRRMWNLPSDAEAKAVVERLAAVGLVELLSRPMGDGDVAVDCVQMHDLLHDTATANAQLEREPATWHFKLLDAYSSRHGKELRAEDGCREWWATDPEIDLYLDKHAVRHLIASGKVDEAALLVARPQWIARQLKSCGIAAYERDVALVRGYIEACPDSVADPKEVRHGLALVLNAVRSGCAAILENPREAHFQLCARLINARNSSKFIRAIVSYGEKHPTRPGLIAVDECVQQADSTHGKIIACNDIERLLFVEESGSVVVGSGNGQIAVFDVESCKRKAVWKAHGSAVSCLAASPDMKVLVSGSEDGTAKVWDMAKRFSQKAACKLSSAVRCVDITPDNCTFVTGTEDGIISIWDIETGDVSDALFGKHDNSVGTVAISPDGQRLASGDRSGTIKVWDMSIEEPSNLPPASAEGELERKGSRLVPRVLARLFGKTEDSLDGGETGGRAPIAILEGHTDWVRALRFSADGKRLLSGSDDKTVGLWDTQKGCKIGEMFSEHTNCIQSVSFSSNGQQTFSVGADGMMCIRNVNGGLERRLQIAEDESLLQAAVITGELGDGGSVTWAAGDWIQVTDFRSDISGLSPRAKGGKPKDWVIAMRMNRQGTRVITGYTHETLMVWDAATGLQVGSTLHGHRDVVTDIAVTPDGERFVSVSWDKTVSVWDLTMQEQLSTFHGHTNWVYCVRISEDGKKAITGSEDGTVRIWNLNSYDGSHEVLEGHSDRARQVCLARDGKHLVSLSDGEAILWDMETRKKLKLVETEDAYKMSLDGVEDLFGVPMLPDSELQIGDTRLVEDQYKIVCRQGSSEFVLATLDSEIWTMAFSPVTKALCVGLSSGEVGIFRLEL